MKSSREIANRAVAHIKANPGARKTQICAALGISGDQFQAATPYIKSECERVGTQWFIKVEKLELE